ncbi:hypothetical protein CEV34_3069 [Brucella pseudogrignonensis]|uniref:Uncharacterized protein n=1 Tax=Brucella pseudogrignonensis TaxID=419475 RepID=A0A256GAG4_9HYPH|nr:hypothetical protein CEV34_3069 [Brucella pseudogrignonensis]
MEWHRRMRWVIEPCFYRFELRVLEQMDGISCCNRGAYQATVRVKVKPFY